MKYRLPQSAISDQAKYKCYNEEYKRIDTIIRELLKSRDHCAEDKELDSIIEQHVTEVDELLHKRNQYCALEAPVVPKSEIAPAVPKPKIRKPPKLQSRVKSMMEKDGVYSLSHYIRRTKVKSVKEMFLKMK